MTNITPQPRGDERGFTVAAVLALIGSVVFLLVCGLVGLEVERASVPLVEDVQLPTLGGAE